MAVLVSIQEVHEAGTHENGNLEQVERKVQCVEGLWSKCKCLNLFKIISVHLNSIHVLTVLTWARQQFL